jgi:hypothetical protein
MAKHPAKPFVRVEIEVNRVILRRIRKCFFGLGYLIGVAGGLIEIASKLGGH